MTYQQKALEALSEPDPVQKCRLITALQAEIKAAEDISSFSSSSANIEAPGVPDKPELVHPRQLSRRGSGTEAGRLALLHAIAHIEFNAMNLALDAAIRFKGLPAQYYRDWILVADDEARHYILLADRLADFDARYGDYPAHQGLWDMALRTAHDPLDRMAMVPRILEARGLDVTPAMIQQFGRARDKKTAEILSQILEEEVAHVEAGSRWFRYLCDLRGIDPETTWFERVDFYLNGDVRCPVNLEDRSRAGFNKRELEWLKTTCRNAAIAN
ncbi:MAG: ferritin-like domain-containing protein [Proteobacteria bacterium]|nr:ferritin-like domain-containing protein [Pseudomonadota bacterium]